MKIVQFNAENVKRLKAVEIKPDGSLVVLAGANAQGKTSILDAIAMALGGGTAAKGVTNPIRDGQTEAQVVLDLGDLIVTRRWTKSGTTLNVAAKDGAKYSSPQSMLDDLTGRLSFDPLAFAGQTPKQQVATLLDLVDLPFDLPALEQERAAIFTARTDVNRRVTELDAQLKAAPEAPEGLPAEEVSVFDLLERAEAARRNEDQKDRLDAQVDAADALVVQREERVREAEVALQEAREARQAAEKTRDEFVISDDDPDVLRMQVAEAEQTNRAVREHAATLAIADRLAAASEEAVILTTKLRMIDERKAEGLAKATMPIEGLGFDETGVTYQRVPFGDCSAAEQLRVSMAMAMALNPKIRVIKITDGSLLDKANMALIAEMAADNDFQVWVERVDESGTVGIVIEDGQVASA